jgi:hypothetical protein
MRRVRVKYQSRDLAHSTLETDGFVYQKSTYFAQRNIRLGGGSRVYAPSLGGHIESMWTTTVLW